MYHDELFREAALIVQGREAFLDEAARAWARLRTWFAHRIG